MPSLTDTRIDYSDINPLRVDSWLFIRGTDNSDANNPYQLGLLSYDGPKLFLSLWFNVLHFMGVIVIIFALTIILLKSWRFSHFKHWQSHSIVEGLSVHLLCNLSWGSLRCKSINHSMASLSQILNPRLVVEKFIFTNILGPNLRPDPEQFNCDSKFRQ